MKQTNPPQPEHSSYPCFSLYDGDKQKCTQVSEASLGEPVVSAGLQEDWAVSKKSCLEVQQLHALPADCVRAQHMSSPHTQVTHKPGQWPSSSGSSCLSYQNSRTAVCCNPCYSSVLCATVPAPTSSAMCALRCPWFSGCPQWVKAFGYISKPAGLADLHCWSVFFCFHSVKLRLHSTSVSKQPALTRNKGSDLLPRGAECSWRLPLGPSPAATGRPGRARSRCPAGCAAQRRCRRPGQARCWCRGRPHAEGPAAIQGSRAAGRLRPRCLCPPSAARSAAGHAWGTRRCGCRHTCRILGAEGSC